MAVRLEALEVMINAARWLCGDGHGESAQMFSEDDEEESAMRHPGTVVKKPKRLAAIKRERSLVPSKNAFGEYAQSFYQPVLAYFVSHADRFDDSDDALDVLLLSQCLLALGAFVKCSINTSHQRYMADTLLTVSFPLRDCKSLHLRRAVVGVLYDCISSLFVALNASSSPRMIANNRAFGTLDFIMNLRSNQLLSDDDRSDQGGENFQMLDPKLRDKVSDAVQWASLTMHDDEDSHSQVLKGEIVRAAVKFFD